MVGQRYSHLNDFKWMHQLWYCWWSADANPQKRIYGPLPVGLHWLHWGSRPVLSLFHFDFLAQLECWDNLSKQVFQKLKRGICKVKKLCLQHCRINLWTAVGCISLYIACYYICSIFPSASSHCEGSLDGEITLWCLSSWQFCGIPLSVRSVSTIQTLERCCSCCSSARWFNASQSSPPAKRHNKYLCWAGAGPPKGSLEISFGPKSATALRMRLGWRLVQVLFLDSAKLFLWTFESTPGKVVNRIINRIVNCIVNRIVNLINLTWEQTKGIQRNTSSRSC